MQFQYVIKCLEKCKVNLEDDIRRYQQKNRSHVNVSDEERAARIHELKKQLTEYKELIKLLTNDRFKVIEADLIRFELIEAKIVLLESMVRKISPKCPNVRQECLDLIKDIQRKYFSERCEHDQCVKPHEFRHFVVLDQSWEVLLRGYINENEIVVITYRSSAPEREVLEQYSDFAAILNMIPVGTLPTIQFGDEATVNRFFLDYSK